jgi:polysaccharide biosynthesis protein PslG
MNETNQASKQYGLKAIIGVGGVIAILSVLLLLDLQFRGFMWQFFWSQTGEESVGGQLQGMIQVTGNLIRPQPNTATYVPIENTDTFPFGINTFFEQETDPEKLAVMFGMIQEAGFGWIRQEFPWEDIEVDGRGQFTDSRNDYDGDGRPDTIDAWEKYDRIVDLADEHDLQMIVRLSNPPNWSRRVTAETYAGPLAPPDDFQDFVNFAVAVAERYKGQITHYQIWNEPNIYPEWGENFADPLAYTQMLCMTYDALKAVDPNIVVISGTIAPTASLDGYFGYQDLVFLQNMYDAGAGDCFDVLSAQGYGLNSGPTDRRFRSTYLNFARHVLYRDIMVANGDEQKSIWLSEVAWNPIEDAFLPIDGIIDPFRFGTVTNEQAARYMPLAYDRMREEWPWIGQVNYWHFTRPTIEEANQASYWFRMVEADYSEENPTFTPLPIYNSTKDYIAQTVANPVLYRGTHQIESWEITLPDDAQIIETDEAEFGEAYQTNSLSFIGNGTAINVRIQGNVDENIQVVMDGVWDIGVIEPSGRWEFVTIYSSVFPEEHSFSLESETVFTIDNILIRQDTWLNLAPMIVIILAGIAGVWFVQKATKKS